MVDTFIRKNKSILYFFQALKCLFVGRKARQFEPKYYPEKERVIRVSRGVAKRYDPIPKLVWLYWEDESTPSYIKHIIEHNKQVNQEYEFRLLNKDTYLQYLPDVVFKANMPVANKTDVIRLELLWRYGGIWIDATVILRDSLDWIQEVNKDNYNELIGFYRDNDTIDYMYPVVETYFMAAPAGSLFVKRWLELFGDIREIGNVQFYKEISKRADFKEISQNIPNPSYLLVYLACQIACRQYPNYHIYLKKAEDSALFLQERYQNNYMMNYAICRMNNPMEHLSVIKICSGDRMFVPFYQRMNMVNKNSLMGFFNKKR